jgi:hypothetical protein
VATHDRSGQMFAVCWHLERRLADIGGWSLKRMGKEPEP